MLESVGVGEGALAASSRALQVQLIWTGSIAEDEELDEDEEDECQGQLTEEDWRGGWWLARRGLCMGEGGSLRTASGEA